MGRDRCVGSLGSDGAAMDADHGARGLGGAELGAPRVGRIEPQLGSRGAGAEDQEGEGAGDDTETKFALTHRSSLITAKDDARIGSQWFRKRFWKFLQKFVCAQKLKPLPSRATAGDWAQLLSYISTRADCLVRKQRRESEMGSRRFLLFWLLAALIGCDTAPQQKLALPAVPATKARLFFYRAANPYAR